MAMAMGPDGPFIGRWTRQALETLEGRPEAWRRSWLELHTTELEEVRHSKPEYADRIEAAAIAPNVPANKTVA
jgi:hypothetical protein